MDNKDNKAIQTWDSCMDYFLKKNPHGLCLSTSVMDSIFLGTKLSSILLKEKRSII